MELNEVYPTLGRLGEPIESFELAGEGFTKDMQVSLSLSRFKTGSVNWDGPAKALATTETLGSKAYIAAGAEGARIVDISDPRFPTLSELLDIIEGSVSAIALKDTTAFLIIDEDNEKQLIMALDVSYSGVNPLWNLGVSGYEIRDITVCGQNLYIATNQKGLYVLDIGSRDAGLIPAITDPASRVTTTSSRVYIAGSKDKIEAYHLLNGAIASASFTRIDLSPFLSTEILGMAAIGEALYVLYRASDVRLELFNVKSDGSVSPVFSMKLDDATDICINSGALMITTSKSADSGEFHIFNLGDSTNPQFFGTCSLGFLPQSMFPSGDRAYVVTNGGYLFTIDIQDPKIPSIIYQGQVKDENNDVFNNLKSIVSMGEYAYIADGSKGLVVENVNDPQNPTFVTTLEIESEETIIAMDHMDGCLYLLVGNSNADTYDKVRKIDLSNPQKPTYSDVNLEISDKGTKGLNVSPEAIIARTSNKLFVFTYNKESAKFDNEPEEILYPDNFHQYPDEEVSGVISGISLSDGYAYVCVNDSENEKSWLWILDTDIESLTYLYTIGMLKLTGGSQGLVSQGSNVFINIVDSWLGGMIAVDASNPNQPFIYDEIVTESNNRKAALSSDGSLIFLLNEDVGIIATPSPMLSPIDGTDGKGTASFLSLPAPTMEGDYKIGVVSDGVNHDQITGAVSFRETAALFKSRAVIVAGGGPYAPDGIWAETQYCANLAYDALLKQGFYRDDIYYLSMEPATVHVDRREATLTNLDYAFNTWIDGETGDLLVYFVDHGDTENFILDYSQPDDQELSTPLLVNVSQLAEWMDRLQSGIIKGRLTFIYDACHSGSFIPGLARSGKERTVITSSTGAEVAWFGKLGVQSFSHYFWQSIYTNGNLYKAFIEAEGQMNKQQHALVDFNGNGIPNEEESDRETLMDQSTLRRAHTLYAIRPGINDLHVEAVPEEGKLTITAEGVTDAQWVSAQIVPPDHDFQTLDPDTLLPEISLEQTDKGEYIGFFDDFSVNGTYIISVTAGREEGFYSYSNAVALKQTISSQPLAACANQFQGIDAPHPDAYEHDDSRVESVPITISGDDYQSHTFHKQNDEDWVRFYGIENNTYKIETVNLGFAANTVLSLFHGDDEDPIEGPVNEGMDGKNEFLDFTCGESGVYHVRISSGNDHFGANVPYELKVARPIGLSFSAGISGIVKGPDLTPLPDVLISTDEKNSAISNKDGHFVIYHMEGKVTLTLISEQYGTMTKVIHTVSGKENSVEVIFGRDSESSPEDTSSGGGGGGGCFLAASGCD